MDLGHLGAEIFQSKYIFIDRLLMTGKRVETYLYLLYMKETG